DWLGVRLTPLVRRSYNAGRRMHILMIAPEPFFEPRGTPFSEYHRIRALLDLGHTVDLVTYPFGRDVGLPGLRIWRSARPPFVRRVRIGPSWAKLALDTALALTAVRRALRGRYDAVHAHEEGAFLGVLLARALGVPHLYDMHSSLPQQLENFSYTRSRLVLKLFAWMERFVVRRSSVVVVICPQLLDVVRTIDGAVPSVLIENAPGSGEAPVAGTGARVRADLGLEAGTPVVLYTGTFEAYQGLDLLLASARVVLKRLPRARFVLVGGEPAQVDRERERASALGIAGSVLFVGQRPADEVPAYLDAADVLVSPRSTGMNTPLKIYQYLRAGKPIVATRLLTHTQVLDDEVAVLTEPSPEALGEGIGAVLADPRRGARLGEAARALADAKYTYEAYLGRTRQACAYLAGRPTPEVAGGVA
ncbi:MAG TPA: glycosyltransferase family 4 protein, partial [Dongiaceae bacterium]|nr:glycosyltransferase family 4 protein [Dongiaceae bacterium]